MPESRTPNTDQQHTQAEAEQKFQQDLKRLRQPQPREKTKKKQNEQIEAKEQKTRQETLAKLGIDFNVCLDAMLQTGGPDLAELPDTLIVSVKYDKDGKKIISKIFNEKVFYKHAAKLLKKEELILQDQPTYLKFLQESLKAELAKPKNEQEMAALATNFIKKLEYFSRPEHSPVRIKSGGKDAKVLIRELEAEEINITYSRWMMNNKEQFKTSDTPKSVDFVRLKVKDLFPDKQNPTFQEICDKAIKELGLELCLPEDGPNYRLAYMPDGELKEQPMGERLSIAMKTISDSAHRPHVFRLVRRADGVWLHGRWASPDDQWVPGGEIVFRLPVLASNT